MAEDLVKVDLKDIRVADGMTVAVETNSNMVAVCFTDAEGNVFAGRLLSTGKARQCVDALIQAIDALEGSAKPDEELPAYHGRAAGYRHADAVSFAGCDDRDCACGLVHIRLHDERAQIISILSFQAADGTRYADALRDAIDSVPLIFRSVGRG